MLQRYRSLKCLAQWVVVALLLNPAAIVFADSDFGANWEPKPLVDHSVIKPVANPPAEKPAAPVQPDLEARLKPAEPFIHDVETRLLISPKPGASLVKRLDTLQTVLFGELKYQDAQELLSKLAEIFPQAAAKAQAGLHQQLLNSQPLTSSNSGKPNTYSVAPAKPAVVYPPANANSAQSPQSQSQYTPAYQSASQPMPQPSVKKKKHFWQDDWESDFENDPFFNDSLSNRSSQKQQQGPSKLSSVGQGLAGLAMMAGGVAGNYYLNKKLGNNTLPNNQQYYNNYPYYSNYGYPYGYGVNPYGYGYAAPYGYGSPYANGYIPPAGAYGSPYGGIITSRPYQTYGTSTLGGLSPLGVPTGF